MWGSILTKVQNPVATALVIPGTRPRHVGVNKINYMHRLLG